MAISDTSREQLQDYDSIRILIYLHPLLALTGDAANYQRSKHIDIRNHFIRDVIAKSQVIGNYSPPTDQSADVLTKALGPQPHLNRAWMEWVFGLCLLFKVFGVKYGEQSIHVFKTNSVGA